MVFHFAVYFGARPEIHAAWTTPDKVALHWKSPRSCQRMPVVPCA
jgi:hypothetical protein